MENLFYLRDVTFKYDLKGSVRNRLVNPIASRDPDIVYLDENLLKSKYFFVILICLNLNLLQ